MDRRHRGLKAIDRCLLEIGHPDRWAGRSELIGVIGWDQQRKGAVGVAFQKIEQGSKDQQWNGALEDLIRNWLPKPGRVKSTKDLVREGLMIAHRGKQRELELHRSQTQQREQESNHCRHDFH
jgi:hypothetical protein